MTFREYLKGDNMKCSCGFRFSGPGELRNCDAYRDANLNWWIICPDCKKEYPSS